MTVTDRLKRMKTNNKRAKRARNKTTFNGPVSSTPRPPKSETGRPHYCECGEVAHYIVTVHGRRVYYCPQHKEDAYAAMSKINSLSQAKEQRLSK